jgi:hypothetical protein
MIQSEDETGSGDVAYCRKAAPADLAKIYGFERIMADGRGFNQQVTISTNG